jgi:hypothetical protein
MVSIVVCDIGVGVLGFVIVSIVYHVLQWYVSWGVILRPQI